MPFEMTREPARRESNFDGGSVGREERKPDRDPERDRSVAPLKPRLNGTIGRRVIFDLGRSLPLYEPAAGLSEVLDCCG